MEKREKSQPTKARVCQPIPASMIRFAESGAGTDLDKNAEMKSPTQDNYIEGYEMTRESVTQPDNSGPSFSGSDIIASVLVLVGVGAIYLGFWKRRNI